MKILAALAAALCLTGATDRGDRPHRRVPQLQESHPCGAAAHRQFDFWVGSWSVKTAAGRYAGKNVIDTAFGGCVVREHWVGADGMTGSSLNLYDAVSGRWHQTWVDSRGELLLLDGGFQRGKMVLRGQRPARLGGRVLHEITWEPLAGGRVRQVWSQSSDGGATWRVVFDGRYERLQ